MPRAKCTLYDPGIEVPLILRWPAGDIGGGTLYEPLVSHVDIVPTLLEALALPRPETLHGRSFWPLLRGRPYAAREAIFAGKTFHTAYEPQRAIRTRTHKLIANLESGSRYDVPDDVRLSPGYPLVLDQITGERPHLELYDLCQDPAEMENLAGQARFEEVERHLRRRLWQWMEANADPLCHGPGGQLASPFYHRTRELLATA
jgi:arylsulfatase A-like enzyme